MNATLRWNWFEEEPYEDQLGRLLPSHGQTYPLALNLKPATDGQRIIRKCGGEDPIDINELFHIFKKGYVAMNKNGCWTWFENEPCRTEDEWVADGEEVSLCLFNLELADDWKYSLKSCEGMNPEIKYLSDVFKKDNFGKQIWKQ